MKILAISASLRAASSSSALLRAAARLAPADWELSFYDQQIGELPHFSPDLDAEGSTPPATVAELRACLAAADGVIISCPEYAHGVPGAFKNALDWIVSSGELGHKPTVVWMASPSGAPFAQAALLPTLEVMEAKLVLVDSLRFARTQLDGDGNLREPAHLETVRRSLDALAAALAARRAPDQTTGNP